MPRKRIIWICRKRRIWNLLIIFSCKCLCSSFFGEFSHLWVYWKPLCKHSLNKGFPSKKRTQPAKVRTVQWAAVILQNKQTIILCTPVCMGSSGTDSLVFALSLKLALEITAKNCVPAGQYLRFSVFSWFTTQQQLHQALSDVAVGYWVHR